MQLVDFASVAFGVAFTLLLLYVIYLRGANAVLTTQNNVLAKEQAASDANLRALGAKVQGLQQPQIIHFTEDQVLKLAAMISSKWKQLFDAEQASALNKLN